MNAHDATTARPNLTVGRGTAIHHSHCSGNYTLCGAEYSRTHGGKNFIRSTTAPATCKTCLRNPAAPKAAPAPVAAPANRIPADATVWACAGCGETLPVRAFPTVTGPQDRRTTHRGCGK